MLIFWIFVCIYSESWTQSDRPSGAPAVRPTIDVVIKRQRFQQSADAAVHKIWSDEQRTDAARLKNVFQAHSENAIKFQLQGRISSHAAAASASAVSAVTGNFMWPTAALNTTEQDMEPDSATAHYACRHDALTAKEYDKFINTAKKLSSSRLSMEDRVDSQSSTTARNQTRLVVPITVQDITNGITQGLDDQMPATTTVPPPSAVALARPPVIWPQRPSILEACRVATLNGAQRLAFVKIVRALMNSWIRDLELKQTTQVSSTATINTLHAAMQEWQQAVEAQNCPDVAVEQLLMFLSGAGGVGKSHVITAVKRFAEAWDCGHTVCVTASTGAAAANLIGCAATTIDAQFNIRRSDKDCTPTKFSAEMMKSVKEFQLVFLDEISMVDQLLFVHFHLQLCVAKDKHSMPFGGVHVIASCVKIIIFIQHCFHFSETYLLDVFELQG